MSALAFPKSLQPDKMVTQAAGALAARIITLNTDYTGGHCQNPNSAKQKILRRYVAFRGEFMDMMLSRNWQFKTPLATGVVAEAFSPEYCADQYRMLIRFAQQSGIITEGVDLSKMLSALGDISRSLGNQATSGFKVVMLAALIEGALLEAIATLDAWAKSLGATNSEYFIKLKTLGVAWSRSELLLRAAEAETATYKKEDLKGHLKEIGDLSIRLLLAAFEKP